MSNARSTSSAVVAEKPSVARDIARVLGATKRGDGYLHGGGWVVTWAVGHLVALAEPHEINPEWKRWRRDALPILPERWPLKVYEQTRDQFNVVRRILNSEKIGRIVCATDAGREGELIFRYIHEAAGCERPFERLWVSSLTPEAIRQAFERLRPGADYDPLAAAARARSRADWLVGMNLSRAYSLDYDQNLSVGRVQTPTLAMLVERELSIRDFVPEDYIEVAATFSPRGGKDETYRGTWFADSEKKERDTRLPPDGERAARIAERTRGGEARVESVERETRRMAPPLLYDLTELQRHANRLYGFPAARTLELAQALYEQRKLLTYPRTDSRYLSRDVAAGLGQIVEAIAEPYRDLLAEGTGRRPLGKRFVDDSKVTDHHALIPTGKTDPSLDPRSDEGRIYDLVCRRLLSAWHKPHIWAVTTVITAVRSGSGDEAVVDRYRSTGTSVEQEGWKKLDIRPSKKAGAAKTGEEAKIPPGLKPDQEVEVLDAEALKKQTKAPRRFTEGTLLTAMESAGRTLDEKELSEAMKQRGLGTPATRAAIIETLLKREYVVRRGKTLEATDKGIGLIEVVHEKVKSPAMTGEWEARLKAIERGEGRFEDFMKGIEDYVREAVGATRKPAPERLAAAAAAQEAPALAASNAPAQARGSIEDARHAEASFGARPATLAEPTKREPVPAGELLGLLRSRFGFDSFRPHQQGVCEAVVEGRDVLLVMPTGAGKSLCYQLPAVARAGTGLVISPLIALMEDQVAKLRAQGLRAERIHSGRDRAESRQVCLDYLDGKLDFLFIAPERLAVPRFPEMLAKRKPALIAVDEAHCISEWGHDFRPEYRMLGQRLPLLRPAPVLAATATATPRVQQDIVEQLGLERPLLSIHGFRRDNIAVEVVELTPSQRPPAVMALLRDPARRPAIIYAPTRKEAERQADELGAEFPAGAYHAGMAAAERDRVQTEFLGGRYEAIIATIAFGMGVDKPDVRTVIHTGLPGSVEAYYQEIGRAGRDGLPSRAVLMHSWNDRRTHEFFHQRDYPEVSELKRIYDALGEEPISRDDLEARLGMDPRIFEKALEKLWIHGGALVEPDETLRRGRADWPLPYRRQSEHRLAQLQLISRFTESHQCRMLDLVRHFGDQEDSRKPCGLCDVCAPEACGVARHRDPTPEEAAALDAVVAELKRRDSQSVGRIYRDMFEDEGVERKKFERLIAGLARAGFVSLYDDSFEKDGRVIEFRRIALTHEGRTAQGSIAPYVSLVREAPAAPKKKRTRKPAKTKKAAGRKAGGGKGSGVPLAIPGAPDPVLVEALRAWRLSEARHRGLPAFSVFPNTTLAALAAACPGSEAELLEVKGIGPRLVKRYGAKILAIVANAG